MQEAMDAISNAVQNLNTENLKEMEAQILSRFRLPAVQLDKFRGQKDS
jgi:hypothetical protein